MTARQGRFVYCALKAEESLLSPPFHYASEGGRDGRAEQGRVEPGIGPAGLGSGEVRGGRGGLQQQGWWLFCGTSPSTCRVLL